MCPVRTGIAQQQRSAQPWLEVSLRTGKYELDNSHKVGERQMASGGPGTSVPIDDDAEVVRRQFGWRLTSNTGRRPRP